MKRACLLFGILLIATTGPTRIVGQEPLRRTGTGNELIQDCTRYFAFLGRTGAGKEDTFNEDPFGMGYCAGLVRGVTTSVNAFHPDIVYRLDGITTAHAVRAVVRYLEDHLDSLDDPDTVLVLRALQAAYVCG